MTAAAPALSTGIHRRSANQVRRVPLRAVPSSFVARIRTMSNPDRRAPWRRLIAVAIALVLVAGCGSQVGDPSTPGPTVPADPVPAFSHVFVLVLENHGYDRIIDSPEMPYLASLAASGGVADAYDAVAHPSQPNYLALFSGSDQGVFDDGAHDLDAPTLADQLEAAGRTWRVVAENYPGDCFTGEHATGGRDGEGDYARKHDPAISFQAIAGDPVRCANIVDLTAFDPAAADYQLIAPNLCHDLHDCDLAVGDQWLAGFVPRILESPAFQDGGVLFITFDEADGGEVKGPTGSGENRVATIVISADTPAGFRSDQPYTHYSLVRTVQEAWGLPCLWRSCEAPTMADFFPGD